MEGDPLFGGEASRWKAGSRIKGVLVLVIVLFVAALAATIVLSVLYVKEKDKDNNVPTPPTPDAGYDHSDDFPLAKIVGWNISSSPTANKRTLSFATTTATWLNIDVSPDGSKIVFDTLGDIYLLDIAGGIATPLRIGVPFETQARFSKDGTKILFTSDQSGNDNIWVMDLATRQETQVTFEPFHYVTNAFWIDAASIVAVKWYTSTRSIGAGEIWIYNISTAVHGENPGVRAVGRPAFGAQVGPEEPVALHAPSGEVKIFYSQNVMDGYTWNYNKDPHQLIYAIFQYNTHTKETSVIASGAGGSARPIVSHSGHQLAYIKRTQFATSLILHDLTTGNDVILSKNLDFDQQESSAPAGVYPSFAFIPDDSAIVIWAQGQIYKISTTNGSATAVPFTINVHIEVSATVRFPQHISNSSSFDTKIVQYPAISGNNSVFAFTSVATTYLYSDGLISAVNGVESNFEFWPTISHDSHWLAHVLWDDQNFATIEVISLTNTTNRYIVPTVGKGRYIQPRFSPSGNSLTYIRLSSDALSGPTYALNAGVYINKITTDANGTLTFSPATLVTDDGWGIAYTSSGDSLLVQSEGYPLQVSEISLKTENLGASVATLATSLYSTEVSVSPNKQHVAFVEFQKVYLVNYEAGLKGGPMNVTAISKGVASSARLASSAAGAQYLTWSYDSSRVFWVWGPVLYELPVSALTSCSHDLCVQASVKSYNLSVSVPSEVVDSQVVVFDNVTILTMEELDEVIPEGRIVVEGSRITALGQRDTIPLPPGALLVDVAGGYVMPGFVDAHAHWDGASDYFYKVKADWEMFVNFAYGVTTLHNPSADTLPVFAEQELIRAGKKIGPRIFSTGQILYGAGGTIHTDISSLEEATNYLQALKSVGAWSAKTYNQPARASRQMILEAARTLQMNIVPEGGMSYYWNLNQIIDGHTTIEHSLPMAPLYDDVLNLFSQSGTAWTPTLIVNYGGIAGERYWYQHTKVWDNERLLSYVPRDVVEPITLRYTGAQDADYHQFATSRAAAEFYRRGGLLETGAHGEMQGIGIHWEMLMFNQSGILRPYEVLRTATINPAKALGLDADIGSLKVGKLADLIFFQASDSPVDNLLNTQNVMWVMKDGHLYHAPSLDQILPVGQTRPPLPQLNLQEKI